MVEFNALLSWWRGHGPELVALFRSCDTGTLILWILAVFSMPFAVRSAFRVR